jgi:hypothetical protein
MNVIDQEPDRIPRGLTRIAAVVIGIMIGASIGATELIGPARIGETMWIGALPAPQIETTPFRMISAPEREARRAATVLQQYGWVDRSRGVIHVPLEVATELYLAEPAR